MTGVQTCALPICLTNTIPYTVYPNSQFENITITGCGNATYNSIVYTSNTTVVDSFKSVNFGYDSLVRTATIIVNPKYSFTQTINLSGCNSVSYNSVAYDNSTSFIDTVKTIKGCDSIYKSINVTVYNVTPTTTTETLIGCGSYTYNAINYTSNIIVRDTVKTPNNCDSIYNLHNIIVIHPTIQNVNLLGCGSVNYNSITYTNSTIVQDTLHSQTGCDSVYKTVNIVVVNPTTENITLSGCNSIVYNSVAYSNSTIVKDTIKSSLGCDSVYKNATLFINNIIPSTQTLSFVGCNSVVYNGVTYINSTVLNQTFSSYQGCDSVYKTINITVHHLTPTTNTTNISGCNTVVYNSLTYTSSTVLRDTVRSSFSNCDSIYYVVNIAVTIVNVASQTINVSGCDSVIFNNVKYTSSTILHDTLVSYQGCDSVYKTININVVAKPTIDVTASLNPVCSTNPTILTATGGSNYTWSPSTALSSTIGASVTASPFSVITYTVTSTNVCVVSKQITVNVNALPNVDAGANKSILLGSSTTLTATGALRYSWNTGNAADTTASINVSPTSNTNYVVTGTNATGCTAQDVVSVSVNFSSVAISPNNYNYGNVVTSTTSNHNITITNNGTLPITLNGISVAAPYSGSVSSQTINAGNSVNISISFTPTATLFYTKTLTISTSIGDFTATLQGRGVNAVPAWVISPTNRNFGNVQVGDSATQTFTVTNTGNVAILTSSIASNNSLFSAKISNTTIAVGGTATITATFKPTAITSSNVVITINTATSGLAAITATVSGTGFINNTPPTLNFVNNNPYNGTSGVNPNVGQAGNYTYRIVYKSSTNTAPQLGFPKVGLDKNGDGDYIDNDEGTFTLNKVNSTTNWVAGEEFTYSTTLNVGNNYGYRFFANDSLGNPATLANAAHNNGPVVTDQTLDLKIFASDITFSVAHPNVGQTFTVFATIHNSTPYSASNVNIRFYTDSLYNNQTILPFIGANSTAVVSMNFVYNTEGFYPIKVWIDSANNLGETNTLNNYAIRPIIVGAFSVPGTILVTSNAYPQTCPTGVVFSGNARYSGLNLVGNPPVLGATVTVKVNGVEVGSTYTITDGNWSVYVPYNCGTNNYQVEVTDFTLTGLTAIQNFAIPCGVSCETGGGTGGDINKEPKLDNSTSTPCCLINNQSFNYALSIVNNGTASSYRDTIKVFVDGSLSYTHTVDSLQVNQTVNYNNAFVLATGNHTLSYTHSYYNAANVRSEVSGSSVVYVEQNLPDLYLASFSQTGSTAFSVRNYNSTCTVAGASKLFIYETNSSYGSPTLIDSIVSTSVSGGKCSNTSVLLNYNRPSWTPGYHYLTLTTDGSNVVSELNETNNSINVVIYVPQPDLYVSNIDVSNSNVHSGDAVNFVATIRNNGAASTAFKVQFKVDNVAVGNKISIASLGAGSSTTISSDAFNIPSGNCPLSIKVIADVDNQVTELVESNNADSINFASDLRAGYNCYATGSSCNPYTIYIGKNLDMQSVITNAGLRDVDTTHIRFKIGSTIIGSDNVNHIGSNSSVATYVSNTFNTVGNYEIAIEADFDNQFCESNEGNNIGYIYVNAVNALPDLRILSQHISPSNLNPAPGQSISVVSTVQNIGNLASTPAMVRFWVDDIQLGVDVPIAAIQAGRDTTVAATITYSNTIVGPKILKVRADINNQVIESDTTNNAATRAIIVGGAPDFARSINEGISFNKSSFRKGETISVCNYIRNFGGDTGRAYIKFYYATATSKTLIDSVRFRLNDHDSIKVCTSWIVNVDSGKIITEIGGATPPEFNVLNNIDSISFKVDTAAMPTATIVANFTTICAGLPVNFNSNVIGAINPTYKWKVNGVYINNVTANISLANLNNKDSVKLEVFENSNLVVTSNSIIVTIKNATSSTTNIAICANQLPYTWGGVSYATFGTFTQTFTNGVSCDSVATLVLSAGNNYEPTINITTSTSTTICNGSTVMFTANATNTGVSPTYQWKKNNVNVGNNSNTYTTNSLANNDSIWCIITNNQTCAFNNSVSSNKLFFVVNAGIPVGATINYKLGGVVTSLLMCGIGDTVQLANYTNNGVWTTTNNSIVGATTASFSHGKLAYIIAKANGTATVAYSLMSSTGCSSAANIVVTVAPIAAPASITGVNSLCVNATTTLGNVSSGGLWSSFAGAATINNLGIVTGNSTGTARIRYTLSNTAGCKSFTEKLIVINALPATPTIGYKAPFSNPQAGAPTGGFCVGKVFGVSGTPASGVWSSTGIISVTNAGIATINAVGAGSLTYTFSNSNGCVNSRTMSGTGFTCAARGVNSASGMVNGKIADFTLYPNPATTFISLKVETLIGTGNIIITDLYGKTVKTQPLSIGNNSLNIANLSKGFYLISTITSEGKTTKKLVVE